jgi:hypothetical protein
LLARDQDEAAQLALAQAKETSLEQVYDHLLIPALTYARRDRERDELSDADENYILHATNEVLEDLGERQAATEEPKDSDAAPPWPRVHLLGCPGRDATDRLGLEMLQQLLDSNKWEMEIIGGELLTAELLALVKEKQPAIICLGAVPTGGLAHTRYLCKRLRAALPEVKLVVGRWGLHSNVEENIEQLREAGADQIETTLQDTRAHLNAWLPVLAGAEPKAKEVRGKLPVTVG